MNWYEDIFERTVNMDEDSYNYTLIAESRFQKVIYADAFLDVDARTIYEGLCNDLRLVSFCDYLKRYVYTKAGLKVPFSQVTLQDYKAIILASFKENRTPPAFRTTSAKLGSLINGWLKQESVSRETVFLLGFGLRMTPGDVSVFLTKALREQDFNFKDPFEMICWYCLKNQYRAAAAIRFREEYDQAIDYGIDFYAPQTVLSPDGRRIMIGWMQNWDACAIREPESPWAGQMSLPRELHIRDGRLYQWPIREFDTLRRDKIEYHDVQVGSKRVYLDGISGRMVDMEITIRPLSPEESYTIFVMHFAEDGETNTAIRFRPHEATLKIDRKFSGSRRAILHQRRCLVENAERELKLRIILDRYSCEIFIDGGRKVMTSTIYTDQSADKISFRADGAVSMDITKYSIVS